jgi:hypothetical protein
MHASYDHHEHQGSRWRSDEQLQTRISVRQPEAATIMSTGALLSVNLFLSKAFI